MDDGFYWIPYSSYKEYGPYPTYSACLEAGVEGTHWSRDFSIQHWAEGNMVSERRVP